MAKKRLNKKVALIGSVVFVLLALAAIWAILHLSRGPQRFIKDGDAALETARQATNEEVKEEEYKRAERNYLRARARAKSDSLRVDILFKLVGVFLETDRWNNVRGCWNDIIRVDPKNLKARFGQLKYIYIVADNGVRGAWKEVASQASELIEVAEDADVLAEDTAQWDCFEIQEDGAGSRRMGPYLYLLRGRATLEMTKMGAVTDLDDSLARAIDDLEKARELEPDNVDVYWHLAQAAITKGEILASRGNLEEKQKSMGSAVELLEQAVENAGDDVRAHINLLRMKSIIARTGGAAEVKEQIQSLEPEYLSLVEKFPSSAQAHLELARFYQLISPKDIDKAISAAEKAVELDEKNVAYAMRKAELHYRRFSIYGQTPEIYKAIDVAKNALTLPAAQDKPGPRSWANRNNRTALYSFLASCCIEQILEPCEARTESESQAWLTDAEQAVHEIEQLYGSGEVLEVVKWQGMLEFAKAELAEGDRNVAIRKLYAAYEQLKASGRADGQLSYTLAKAFENTSEVGAVMEFLTSALNAGIGMTKPETLSDYADVLLKLRAYNAALRIIDSFEYQYWANERSNTLRIRAYIGANQFDEAEEELAKRVPDDPNTIKLNLAQVRAKIRQVRRAIAQKRTEGSPDIIVYDGLSGAEEEEDVELQAADELMTAELKSYGAALGGLVEKLLVIEPNAVSSASVVAVCNNYISEGKTSEAEDLVNRFLGYFPDNTAVLFYKQLISEPEPRNIPQQRRREIRMQVLSNISDPISRAMNLGMFYRRNNEPNKAAVEFKNVLKKIKDLQEGVVEQPALDSLRSEKEITDLHRVVASSLFNIALRTKDWGLAEQIVEVERRENFDGCTGEFFAGRLAAAKEEYEDALARLNECLRQRPVFSYAYRLRSEVNAALGNEHASIEDARKAASLNPLDGTIAKVLANVLYQRNQKLGDNVSSNQIIETRDALIKAMRLSPSDARLLGFYAEYISKEKPAEALAIRKRLQKAFPSVRNALLLGRMAMRMAVREAEAEQKKLLFDIAASSFEQARAIEPQNETVLKAQAEYYRLSGQPDMAEELLEQSQEKKLLWDHYLLSGQFDDARRVLEQLYQSESKDSSVVRGLLLVAESTGDKESVKKYSEELLLLDDSMVNRLFQIQIFLDIGLIKEAEYKLQSFGEKYPDEPRALLLEAWLALRQGQLERALELTNRSLQGEQDNAMAWRLRGQIHRLMANYDQAIIDLKRSKSLSDKPVTQLTLAKAYLGAGRAEDAITELENTFDNPQAPMESRVLLERVYLQLGRKEALMRFYREILEKFPDNLLWYSRAAAFALATRDFSRAEQLYEQAWQKGQKSGGDDAEEVFDGYLQVLLSEGKFEKVFEEARKYVDGEFAPVAFVRMAEAKLKLGDKDTALQYCRKAIAKAFAQENETLASWALQRMYSLLGAEEVIRYCKERLEADPDSLAANYTMYSLARIKGEYNKAIVYVDKCLRITGPGSPSEVDYIRRKAEVLYLAYIKTYDGNYLEKAITEYESLLAKMPNNTGILNNLAYMLAEANVRLADALEYARRAHEARPNDPRFMDTYSYVLYKNGKFREAAELLQSALQQFEQSRVFVPADVYEHLGMIKEELGSGAEAVAAYKQALEIGGDTLSEEVKQRIKAAIERVSLQQK